MDVILQWKMPRAYKAVVLREAVKLLWRGVVLGVTAVFILGGIALRYLRTLDPAEANRIAPLIFYVAAFAPMSMVLVGALRYAMPIYYKVTASELTNDSDRIFKWEHVERYTFEASDAVEGLRMLKIKVRGCEGYRFCTFDPAEVEEARIARVFEEQLALHRQE